MSSKHKLARYFMQFFVIGSSNNMVAMQLIKGSKEMHYLLALSNFHYFFQVKLSDDVLEN
jgi:hypothetical protein